MGDKLCKDTTALTSRHSLSAKAGRASCNGQYSYRSEIFGQFLTDGIAYNTFLPDNPLESIKKLSEEVAAQEMMEEELCPHMNMLDKVAADFYHNDWTGAQFCASHGLSATKAASWWPCYTCELEHKSLPPAGLSHGYLAAMAAALGDCECSEEWSQE